VALGRGTKVETAGILETMSRYGPHGYLVFSPSQVAYAHSYGLAPDGTLARIQAEVAADPHFRPLYRADGAAVYLFTRTPGK
jgi:hypothetical protein